MNVETEPAKTGRKRPQRPIITCARCRRRARHGARQLCVSCYEHVTDHGDLADYPARLRTRADVISEYVMLVELDPSVPNRALAARIGVSPVALERALTRARKAGELAIRRRPCGPGRVEVCS